MNDPNGMVVYKWIYHLFYQYYPGDIVWRPMHWGHDTSNDLIHWTNKKIALFPDTLGMIFSGRAVVNLNNTSGLGTTENPPMIAISPTTTWQAKKRPKRTIKRKGWLTV